MKKNFQKIPIEITQKLREIKSSEVVVGCAVKYKSETLVNGRLAHLGIMVSKKGLVAPPSVIPPADQGKYSKINVDGLEIIRNDLPKEKHFNSVEAPNWGNDYYGTHTVDLPYEKYPREFIPPRELEILINCNNPQPGLSEYILAFKINETLNRKSRNFKKRLFENINILQENIGACGVVPAKTALEKYEKSLQVSWEILPPGTLQETLQRLFKGRYPSKEEKAVAEERYDFFMSLKPKRLVFGSSGFRRYFGALIEDDLVVFENIQYGNAVYILYKNWKELSKKSRIELLSGKYGKDFERVVHRPGWKKEIRLKIKTKRQKQKIKQGMNK